MVDEVILFRRHIRLPYVKDLGVETGTATLHSNGMVNNGMFTVECANGLKYSQGFGRSQIGRFEPITSTSLVQGNPMPKGWRLPPNINALRKKYREGCESVLPVTRNAVSLCAYMDDGRMQLERRGGHGPNGGPICDPYKVSIHGGLMESDLIDIELGRETYEELGILIGSDDVAYIGDVYDPKNGRSNHVFRLIKGYDSTLIEQAKDNVAWVVNKLTRPESVGRDFNVWREELDDYMHNGVLAPITEAIFREFPELMPPPRPKG